GRAAALRALPIGAIGGTVIEAVTVAEEGGGDVSSRGEIIGGGSRSRLTKAFPSPQLDEAGEADAVALGETGGGDGQAHGLAVAAVLILGRAVIGHQGQPAIDLGGELHRSEERRVG